jgi:sugar lactone lactonase YvrE
MRRVARRAVLVLAAIAALAGVFLLWPSPIQSVAVVTPPALELTGALAPNTALRSARFFGEAELSGAEDVAVDAAGRLYTGTADGQIVRITLNPQGYKLDTVARTGGRPLGLRFDAQDRLFVADADRGLLEIGPKGGVTVLAQEAAGLPIRLANELDIASDGTIYFTDSSLRFPLEQYLYDLLEGRPHGRFLAWDPRTRKATVLRDGLCFANGVTLAAGGEFALVSETYRHRIWRYWLKGEKAGTFEVFAEHLPGFPDNLSRDEQGRFWAALFTVRNPMLDRLHPRPFLKDQMAKLPRLFWPKPKPYGLLLVFDESGRIVRSYHDPGGQVVRRITSAEPHGKEVYLGSLDAGLGIWPRP